MLQANGASNRPKRAENLSGQSVITPTEVLEKLMRWLIVVALCSIATFAQSQTVPSDRCVVPNNQTRTRPNPGVEPIVVRVGVFLIDVIGVNEVEESFGADFVLSLSWHDPRLSAAERGASLENCRLSLAEVWHPRVDAINQRGVPLAQNVDVDISVDGTVSFSERLTGMFSSPLDLHRFPFDTQTLRIQVASFEYGPEDVRFVVREPGRVRLAGIVVPGWEIVDVDTDEDVAPVQSDAGEHTRLDYVIAVERHWPYYIWKFVIPLIFIVLMAWSVLWLDPTEYRTGIGVATASVFSLIAFLLGLRQMTPRVPYLTQMDQLVLSVTLLVFLALGEVVTVSRLVHNGRIELARRVDGISRWIYLASVIVALLVFFKR